MKAVILAAGEGRRMRPFTLDKPKCLIKLLGLTLIERIILSLKKAGIKDILIVVGYKSNKIKKYLGNGSRYDVQISYIENPEWKRGDGWSLYVTKNILEKEDYFLVLMSDHIFMPDILKRLLSMKQQLKGFSILCVDNQYNRFPDIKEATKVLIDKEGNIYKIGKGLSEFNGIDCGIFLLTPDIFTCLEEMLVQKEQYLTDAIRRLIAYKKLKAFSIGDFYWQDIDNIEDLKIAEAKILKNAISPQDGIIAKKINRKISLRITKIIVKTRLTAIQLSLISFVLGLFSAIFFILRLPLVAGIIAQLSSILDGVDGEIAKVKFQSSEFGSYLDSILDRYADAFVIIGMSIYVYFAMPHIVVLLISLITLMGLPMSMLSKQRFQTAFGKPYLPKYDKWTRYLLADRCGRLFLIMLGGITGYVFLTLIVLGITTNLQAIYRLITVKRISRNRKC